METKYLIIVGGSTLFLILIFQVLSGLGKLKAPVKYHKWGGLTLLVVALFHAVVGVIYLLK